MLQSKHAIKPFYRRLQSFLFVEKSTRIDQNQLKSTKIDENQPKSTKTGLVDFKRTEINQNGFGWFSIDEFHQKKWFQHEMFHTQRKWANFNAIKIV